MTTGGGPGQQGAATPHSELARIRASQERRNHALRERLLDAMLEQCGHHGYRQATVQCAIEACGTNRVQFYRHFASKSECYATAFEERMGQFCADVLAAGAGEDDWTKGLCAALRTLGTEIVERPDRMRGMLVDVHVAGGPALARRAEILERFSRAIDRARLDPGLGHASPPSLTAAFMVGAIEASVTRSLINGRPQDFVEALPELAQMVAGPYFVERAGNADDPKELGMLLRAAMLA